MPPKKNRFFTCLGCVIAGPLGCLAFLGGGVLVGIYLLPELGENLLERELSNGFREGFHGDLDVGSLDLSWTSTQRFDDLVLRDPDGRVVLRADLRVPPLLDFFDEDEFGDVTVELDAHVVVDEQGTTNFARALEPREDITVQYDGESWEAITRDLFRRKGTVRVSLRELELVTPATLASGAPMRFSDLEATLVYGTGEPLDLRVVGSTGEGPVALEALLAREAFEPTGGGDPGISGRFSASRVPTALVAAFSHSDEELRQLFGARMDVALELDPFAAGGAPLRVKVGSDAAVFELRGSLEAAGLAAASAGSASLQLDADVIVPPSVAAECSNGLVLIEWLGEDPKIHVDEVELGWSRGSALALVGESFTLDVPPLAVRRAENGAPIALRGAKVVGSRSESAGWKIRGEVAFDALSQAEPLVVALTSSEPLRVLARDPGVAFEFAADGDVPLAELERLCGLDAALAGVGGEKVELHAALAHGPAAWPLELAIRSENAWLTLEGMLAGSPFLGADLCSALDFQADAVGIPGSILDPILPAGVTLDWTGSDPVAISYEGWRAREAGSIAAIPAISVPPGAMEDTESVGGSVTVSAGRVALRDASLSSRGLALDLVDFEFSARGDARSMQVDVTALVAESGGPLEVDCAVNGLAGPFGLDGFELADLRVKARAAPTELVDAKVAAQGLLSAVFGPEVDLDLRGKGVTAHGGRFGLVATSPRASGELEGYCERGVQVTGAKLELVCELDEATFARVLAPLVPTLASARPADPGGRFALALDEGVLPIDGDLARFAGACRIDLDGAEVALAPELLAYLVLAADGEVTAAASEPIALRLAGGRVSPERLVLPLPGGPSFAIEGGFGLDGSDVDLQTEFPLRIVGPEVSPILHGMSGLLRPEMGVPVVVRGQVGELSMSVRPQWIRTVGDVLGELVPDVLKESLRKLAPEDR